MHYTASPGAPAKNISKYFAGLAAQNPNDNVNHRYAGAHFSVDRTSIYNSIPISELAYHVGSTTYTKEALTQLSSYPNNCTVGIEMCIEKDGSIHEGTFNNVVDLVVYLIKKEGFPNSIWTHKGIVGWKDCPLPWVKNPSEFERFKKAVNDKLNPPKPIEEEDEVNKVLEYGTWAWEELDKYIGDAYNDKIISEWSWVEKVRKKKLTYGELILLKVLIDERRRNKQS
ncbi:N-acetylmuramoyl-L-alanine amidase [Paenibacillus sp. D2_2]|uniref:peptidoglycan recognition protein family protein n=1 Tax=Paenibacillus sp. D2_2 TaxID=3073092 RepID=UPI0028154A23|nr:N-acetylmuramoyl-L-alanine amidase [Paenibacillus sp. D2_2]WMT39308.1 N-acetylmuramoyl-L-alanine amidase [Paenibacillus sp. D2_2]